MVSDKNIEVSEYKKLLAGILVKVQEQVFAFLDKLDETVVLEETLLRNSIVFILIR